MRQPTTAEVRLDQHKSSEFRPSGAEHLAVLAFNESAAIEFRCRGTPRDGEIAANNFGIREMSVYMPVSKSFSAGGINRDFWRRGG
jgi:hypothetical protein